MLGMHDFFKVFSSDSDAALHFQGQKVAQASIGSNTFQAVADTAVSLSTGRLPSVPDPNAAKPQSRMSDAIPSPFTDTIDGGGAPQLATGQTMRISRDRILSTGAEEPAAAREAPKRQTGRYAVAGYPKPYVDDPEPPHGYVAPAAGAPQVVACPNCHATFKIAQTGKFRCPSCNTSFMVDQFFGPEYAPATSQLALQFTPECREGLSMFMAAMARRAGFGARLWSQIDEALNEVLNGVLGESYDNQVYSVFTIAITPERRNLVIRVGTTGKPIQTNATTLFPNAIRFFKTIDVKAGSKGGSVVTMTLARSS